MSLFSKEYNNLDELFEQQIEDLYDAEKRWGSTIEKMSEASASPQLKQFFTKSKEQSCGRIERMEQVFDRLGEDAERETCQAMKGLVSEADDAIGAKGDEHVKDAALIASAQRVKHYQMAGYGTARSLARQIGREDVATLLQESLVESKRDDEELTRLAETSVNLQASTA